MKQEKDLNWKIRILNQNGILHFFSFLVQKLIRGFIFFAGCCVKLHIFFMLNLTRVYNFHAKRPLL